MSTLLQPLDMAYKQLFLSPPSLPLHSKPILESKNMRAIFQKKGKKGQKSVKKGQNISKFGQKCNAQNLNTF